MTHRFPILVLMAFLSPGPALANDSSAVLGAGGLVLVEADDIVMASEDLSVSTDEIRVHYVFENKGPAPVERIVAFPLPELDLSALAEQDMAIPSPSELNFLDFVVKADGRMVNAAVEIRAFRNGQEVTEVLRPLGLLDGGLAVLDFEGPLGKLTPVQVNGLIARDLIVQEQIDMGQGWQTVSHPLWTLRITYHWKQVFPAGRPLEVDHRYKPVVGQFFYYPELLNETETMSEACVDAGTKATIRKRFNPDREEATVSAIDYVLTTGANWAGPIGHFRLTVDKGRPENVVSFCGEGVKKISPTQFRVEYRDFTPRRDLSVLIFSH